MFVGILMFRCFGKILFYWGVGFWNFWFGYGWGRVLFLSNNFWSKVEFFEVLVFS